jgi:hypothetical protein
MHWTDEGDGWVAINALGMRDVERTVARVPGVFRIAVFGDSMTEAVQVNLEQTFTQLLERRLREEGLSVEVLNFGVNGYSPLASFLLYKNVGRSFQPDLVIHAVYLDNDIADGDTELAAGQTGAPFVRPGVGPGLEVDYSDAEASYRDYHAEPIHTIRRWSATYRALSTARVKWRAIRNAAASLQQNAGVPKRFMVYADPLTERWEAAWRTYERIFDAFSAEVRAAGSSFAVMNIPAGHVVSDSTWRRVLSYYPEMNSQRWSLEAPQRRLLKVASERQIQVIQVDSDLRQYAGGEPLYFDGVGHLTPLGHQIIAQAVARFISSHSFSSSRVPLG